MTTNDIKAGSVVTYSKFTRGAYRDCKIKVTGVNYINPATGYAIIACYPIKANGSTYSRHKDGGPAIVGISAKALKAIV